MRRITRWDWLGAITLWFGASFGVGAMLDVAGAPEQGVVAIASSMFFGGLVAARIWWLRRGDDPSAPRDGLTTGEMTAQRLAEMEARIYELEERLALAERLLAEPDARTFARLGDG